MDENARGGALDINLLLGHPVVLNLAFNCCLSELYGRTFWKTEIVHSIS
jgi:hypothetical protein